MTYWSSFSLMVRGAGMFEAVCLAGPLRFFSWSMIDWHSSMHSPQMYTSPGPSTRGPTSRWLRRQNEQYALRLRPAVPGGLRPPVSPVVRSEGIGLPDLMMPDGRKFG